MRGKSMEERVFRSMLKTFDSIKTHYIVYSDHGSYISNDFPIEGIVEALKQLDADFEIRFKDEHYVNKTKSTRNFIYKDLIYMADIETRPTNFIRQIIDADLASGKHNTVQTRFPPEPNGYLHIGHAKSICLNFGLGLKYNAPVNLRFDDTNPAKEEQEYVDSIKEDVKWLGFNWSEEVYSSDYFQQLYEWAVAMIKKGKAYVDSYRDWETKT